MINAIKYIVLFLLVTFISCSEKEKTITYIPAIETTDAYDLDGNETMVTKNIPMQHKNFINTVTNDSVSIIHYLDNTSFHFYNDVAFANKQKGVIVGGAGLKIRTTTNGGLHWQENRFSKFANSFHSVSINNQSIFAVGESKYIYKSTDFGKHWATYNTNFLINKTNDKDGKIQKHTPRFYKIKFYNNTGIVIGDYDKIRKAKPILLKTIDSGKHWQILKPIGLKNTETGISDLVMLSEKNMFIVTFKGNCYKSIDGGIHWKLIFNDEALSLNSIDFINENQGYIGGTASTLFYTKDGGKTWKKINLFSEEEGVIYYQNFANKIKRVLPNQHAINITNIKYINNTTALITLANSTQEFEKDFLYKINQDLETVKSVLHKKDTTLLFKGNSYGFFKLKKNLFLLDRNNLYKLKLN